jgi:hypothetical protein
MWPKVLKDMALWTSARPRTPRRNNALRRCGFVAREGYGVKCGEARSGSLASVI